MSKINKFNNDFYSRILDVLKFARTQVVKTVNSTMVETYFEIGRLIIEEEQNGSTRAEYGKQILKELSARLTNEFGLGFSVTNLQQMKNFYSIYRKQQTVSVKSDSNEIQHPQKFTLTIWILFFGLLSCKEVNSVKFYLDFIDSHTYYSEEIIPDDYQNIYGKWKLYKVSGGIHGTGHEPDYDYLEMKSVGIYGLIRNDNLFEYGKIKLDTFDLSTKDFLQVRFIPDYTTRVSTDIYPSEKYLYLKGTDSLDLISPCCDLYNYHYKRVK